MLLQLLSLNLALLSDGQLLRKEARQSINILLSSEKVTELTSKTLTFVMVVYLSQLPTEFALFQVSNLLQVFTTFNGDKKFGQESLQEIARVLQKFQKVEMAQ